ncbi:hypothetical protein QQF73_18385 [Marinobacter sp. M216]|uniref:Uncharacterized protein n=1 Tax=Marinobacter albus TaxID=3030833 RepID=A0ABT7HIE2_9GAMM|nr:MULTISPECIES: hypothetical protein [unclassified Marinobacter]MBW7472997.1 hypothetical protein [Marinobacter sp. F4218]MDK9559610.1 hypothetical protein [Marinobacter sp. M216]
MQAQERSDADSLALARTFRFGVSVLVVAALVWYLLGALERETRKAEEQAANMVMNQLRAALVIKGAEVMLSRHGRLEDQEGLNPFDLVKHRWSNYSGACQKPASEPGTWCFWRDESRGATGGWLIFTPNQPITLNGRRAPVGEPLAWSVTTDYADRNENGEREHQERLTGLKLAPVSLTGEAVRVQDAGH